MSIKTLAALGGLAQGWNEGERSAEDRAKVELDRQYQLEQRELLRKDQARREQEYQEQDEIKKEQRNAARPVAPTAVDPVFDGSGPMRQQYRSGGSTFDTEDEARAHSADPVEVLKRQSQALAARGYADKALGLNQLAQREADDRVKRKDAADEKQFGLKANEVSSYIFAPGGDPFQRAVEMKQKMDPSAKYEMSRAGNNVVITRDGQPFKTYTDDNEGKLRLLYGTIGANTAADQARMLTAQAGMDEKKRAEQQRAAEAQARNEINLLRAQGNGRSTQRAPSAAELKASQAASRGVVQVAMDDYAATYKEAPKEAALPAPTDVRFYAESLAKYNPQITSAQLAHVAAKVAANPSATKFTFDKNGGVVKSYVDQNDSNVNFVVQRVPAEGVSSLSKEDKAALMKQSVDMLNRVAGGEANVTLLKKGLMERDEPSLQQLRNNWHQDAMKQADAVIQAFKKREVARAGRDIYKGGEMEGEPFLRKQQADRIIDEKLEALGISASLFEPLKKQKQPASPSLSRQEGDSTSSFDMFKYPQ